MRQAVKWTALAAIGAIVLACPASAQSSTAGADFLNLAGERDGHATLTQTPKGVLIDVDVSGLPPGEWVAVHIHQTGSCDYHSHYESAGGHFNPSHAEHGFLAANGPHAGDLPNQQVGRNGVLHAQIFDSFVTLDGGDSAIRGKALIIHTGKDDYKSQPSGAAGGRQSCAVIK